MNVYSFAHFFAAFKQNNDIIRTAVLVIGALAGDLYKAGDHENAHRIVTRIEDKLGIHGEMVCSLCLINILRMIA